ncbi:MAG: endonuclease [Bacteroidota bacterium]
MFSQIQINKSCIALFIALTQIGLAQIPSGYYNSAQGLNGNALKIALHNIIDNHTQISYNGLWTAFQKTDKKPNGKVWDMYSDIPSGTPPYDFTFVSDQCGNYAVEGDCYNREHSWPQSWFNSVSGPVSDLFHIYATDGKVNGERGNYPYGNVSNPSLTTLNGGKVGPCSNLGYSQTVFEPINEYKGDFARSYFYMSTRYYSEDGSWSFSPATNKSIILPWQMNVLLQWNQQDPVSLKEISRNDSIYYKYQNNRNPFIDRPDWADSIWTMDVSVFIKELEYAHSFSLFPNPSQDHFSIKSNSQHLENSILRISDITGRLIEERKISLTNDFIVDCSQWHHGFYFISVSNEHSQSNFKFLKE